MASARGDRIAWADCTLSVRQRKPNELNGSEARFGTALMPFCFLLKRKDQALREGLTTFVDELA